MSWFRGGILSVALGLAGCGFQPVLAPGAPATELLGQMDVVVKSGRADFEFRDRLLQRLGSGNGAAPFRLDYDMTISESVVSISTDASLDRFTLTGVVAFRVIDQSTDTVKLTETVRATAGYSATAETFPTRVAARDAELRLVQTLADQVIQILQISADSIVQ